MYFALVLPHVVSCMHAFSCAYFLCTWELFVMVDGEAIELVNLLVLRIVPTGNAPQNSSRAACEAGGFRRPDCRGSTQGTLQSLADESPLLVLATWLLAPPVLRVPWCFIPNTMRAPFHQLELGY